MRSPLHNISRRSFAWLVVMVATLAVTATGASVARAGSTLTVCASSCDYGSIQDAIDAASSGDTITVTGDIALTSTVNVSQSVTIQGDSGATVTANGLSSAFAVSADGVTIENFSFSAPDGTTNNGFIDLAPGANHATITDNHFTGGFTLGDSEVTRGVVVSPGVTDMNITDNQFEGIRQPAYLDNGDTGTISGNYAAGTKGWVVGAGSGLSFTGNTWGSGSDRNAVDIAIITNASSSDNYADILALSQANNDAVIDNQYEHVMSSVYVDASASGGGNGYWNSPFQSVQNGVNAVVATGTVNVAAGNYSENVTIDKTVSLAGAGASTVISGSGSGTGITLGSNASDTKIQDLTVQGFSRGIDTGGGANNVTFSSVDANNNTAYGFSTGNGAVVSGWTFDSVSATGNAVGFRNRGQLTGLTVSNSHFDGNGEGWDCTTSTGQLAVLTQVSVSDSTFNNNSAKGMYFECLDHATFTNVQVEGSGTSGSAPTGVDINLKYQDYQSVSFVDSTISGSTGAGIYVKGRNDGSYASPAASLIGFSLTGSTVTGNATGVIVENNVTSVALHNDDLSGNTGDGLKDNRVIGAGGISSVNPIDATNNWWGSAAGPGTLPGVTTTPFCVNSSCTTPAPPNNGGGNSGGGNTNSGGNTGGGGNSSGGGGGGGSTPPTTNTTPAAPSPPAVNQPQTVTAAPATSGSVAVTVVPTTTNGTSSSTPPVSVAASWPAGTFTVPVTVQVAPQPQAAVPDKGGPGSPPKAVAGGFAVGNTVVQLTVTSSTGAAVTSFQEPIKLHISSFTAGQVPAYSHDGTSWTTIPRLSSPALPAGQTDGYYVNADGSIDIYTRHATLFGLLLDTQAPGRVTLQVRASGKKLRLLLKGARDNVRVDYYTVLLNGRTVKTTKHGYLVLPARVGRLQVITYDAAGNHSQASSPVTVVRTHSKKHPFQIKKG